jgi:hypothetical protein
VWMDRSIEEVPDSCPPTHETVRICWSLSFCLLWVGLFAKGK